MIKKNRVALLGMMTSVALIASYIESLVPSPVPMVPGIKLGIANVIILTLLYVLSAKEALFVNVMRIVLIGLMFSGIYGMVYSLAGGILSFSVMCIAKHSKKLSIIGISVMGGVFHNIGQIIVASIVLQNQALYYYLPILMVSGIITGILVGYVAKNCIKVLKKYDFWKQ